MSFELTASYFWAQGVSENGSFAVCVFIADIFYLKDIKKKKRFSK